MFLAQAVFKVHLEFLVEKERLETPGSKAHPDLLDSLVNQDCQEPRVVMDDLVLLDQKGRREIKETQDHLDLLDPQEMMVNMVKGAQLDRREKRESLAIKVDLVQEDHPVLKDLKEILGPLGSLEHLENKAQEE